ncbi:hypothetical protein PtB15_12B227 [Puccinia triticina]|nr:hypothetical protein PtB15_12B227 [Puccinia triticina]
MEDSNQRIETDDYIYNGTPVHRLNVGLQMAQRADAQGNQSQGPRKPLDDLVDSRFWNDIEAAANNARTIDDKIQANENPQPPVNPDANWQEVMNHELHNISLGP